MNNGAGSESGCQISRENPMGENDAYTDQTTFWSLIGTPQPT